MARLLLQGRGVLVTGAAGGIGAAVARRLVRAGARPVLLDLTGERLDAVAAELGPAAVPAPADVRDRDQVVAAVDAACEVTGGLIGAVIGAGLVRPETLVAQTEADARNVVDVNFYGTLWAFQAAMPHIDRQGGHALALSSIAGIAPIPLSGVYPATKAAVDSIVATVRTEAMNRPSSAGVVYLSAVDTQMNRDVQSDARAARAAQHSVAFLTRAITADAVAKRIVRALERRSRVVTAPRWLAPSVWPQTLTRAIAEWFMGHTALREELPGGRESAQALTERAGTRGAPERDGGGPDGDDGLGDRDPDDLVARSEHRTTDPVDDGSGAA
ncbi:SDR family oxidoreductase [Patulibacter minatonensis]|uniref:SDR family oxidoreductase n=1 Tax=Patulibacter minatonensis TaxID=298163 RepID=UPI0004B892BD|nr:SDR family NAD(P)-dependent oxidoreductase [Patulibacter minatonensis]